MTEEQAASDAANQMIRQIEDRFRRADFRTKVFVFNDLFVLCDPVDTIAICGGALARILALADETARADTLAALAKNIAEAAEAEGARQ